MTFVKVKNNSVCHDDFTKNMSRKPRVPVVREIPYMDPHFKDSVSLNLLSFVTV